jgi:hypothetical protein
MKTLLLYAFSTDFLSYYDDWVDAFQHHFYFDTTAVNLINSDSKQKKCLELEIKKADLIVLHHSMTADTLRYLSPLVSLLKNRKGKLVSFVGNEVNLPILGMKPKIQILKEIAPDIIATQLLEETGKWLYSECKKSTIISLPHALNPKKFYPTRPQEKRLIDLGTRSARYGVYIGDDDRNNIGNFFEKNYKKYGISIDLGIKKRDQSRFDRESWKGFLNCCKGMISTEAGSFYLEKDDQTINSIVSYLKKKKNVYVIPSGLSFFEKIGRWLPPSIKRFLRYCTKGIILESHRIDEETSFEEIKDIFFQKQKRCPFYSKAISSRHFDCIGTHTLNVMFPGRYNDILKPHKHYFPLEKDFSNIQDLIDLLGNSSKVKKITERAYNFVIESHTHSKRLNILMGLLNQGKND